METEKDLACQGAPYPLSCWYGVGVGEMTTEGLPAALVWAWALFSFQKI